MALSIILDITLKTFSQNLSTMPNHVKRIANGFIWTKVVIYNNIKAG